MKYLLLSLFLSFGLIRAQVFKPVNGQLKLLKDTSFTEELSSETFDQCWCEPVYGTDSTIVKYLLPKNEDKGRILVKKGGWGLIDKNGKVLESFTSVDPYTYDRNGRKILFKEFDSRSYTLEGNSGSFLQLVDTAGVELKKVHVRDDYKGSFLASEDLKGWGIMNGNMRILLAMKYDPARYTFQNFRFNENGLIPLESKGADNKYGIVNYKGEIQVGFRYDFMIDYIKDEDCIYAEVLGKKGYINSHGGVVFPITHTELPFYKTDSNLVATENYVWFMDENFHQIRDLKFQLLQKKGDVYFFKRNNLWGVMDDKLNIVVKNLYSSIDDGPRIRDNNDFKTYVVVKSGKFGVIDLEGNVIIPCKYNCRCSLGYFSPTGYFIEFSEGNIAYRFNEKGEVISKSSTDGKACLCESYE